VAQLVCRYRKEGEVRWISHLDVKRTLERAMRRADLPLALSQGHSPRPRISYGPPLPLGATGEGELFAVQLAEPLGPAELKERLNRQLPDGLEIVEAWGLPAHRKKETFGDLDVAEYRVTVQGPGLDPEAVSRRVAELLGRDEIVVHRGGKRPEREVDIRPLVMGLEVVGGDRGRVDLHMRLRTGSHGGARAQEIVELLGLVDEERLVRYHRTGIYASAQAPAERRRGVWRRWTRSDSR
jgi:radical SAM-linked protein